jgi:AmiR/NasT family two-component response regulator
VINKRTLPIRINVFGEHRESFVQHQPFLYEQGYEIQACLSLENLSSKTDTFDILIVEANELDSDAQQRILNLNKPYLLYLNDTEQHGVDEQNQFISHASGYFVDLPTAKSICLKVQLAIQHHTEQQKVSQRLSDIDQKFESNRTIGIAVGLVMAISHMRATESFEFLRQMSRDHRCRLGDVATLMISHFPELAVQFKDLMSLKHWLETNLNVEHQRD